MDARRVRHRHTVVLTSLTVALGLPNLCVTASLTSVTLVRLAQGRNPLQFPL